MWMRRGAAPGSHSTSGMRDRQLEATKRARQARATIGRTDVKATKRSSRRALDARRGVGRIGKAVRNGRSPPVDRLRRMQDIEDLQHLMLRHVPELGEDLAEEAIRLAGHLGSGLDRQGLVELTDGDEAALESDLSEEPGWVAVGHDESLDTIPWSGDGHRPQG